MATKFSDKIAQRFHDLMAYDGLSYLEACKALKMSASTFHNWKTD